MNKNNDTQATRPFDELVEKVAAAIDDTLEPAEAAVQVRAVFKRCGITFDEDSWLWLTLLCRKWHDKTPDIRAQAEGIVRAVLSNVERPLGAGERNG